MTTSLLKQRPLVIVESPTKAKTLKKLLPHNFTIVACNGHVRDLPQSSADIPDTLKKEAWAKIGVDTAHDFKPLYIVPKTKTKVIAELKKLIKEADSLLLATDEDREGESISWHLLELLKPKIPYARMVFHEITESAIKRALDQVRTLDEKLVRAQETRRILDRLVGYTLSPLLWNKIAFGLSAGRVQSVAVKLIVQRERERIAFVSAGYAGIEANLAVDNGARCVAKLVKIGDKKIATGKDFDETTGLLLPQSQVLVLDQKKAQEIINSLHPGSSCQLEEREEKAFKRTPAPPFITSTLQQEANRKLGLSSRDTMRIAQGLYEKGFITYMRTDSVALSQEAIHAARQAIVQRYGDAYLSATPRQYASKSKNAQEAHEAIRPSGTSFKSPQDTGLLGLELALYEIIYRRTMASQMRESEQKKTTLLFKIESRNNQTPHWFQASGLVIVFPGFLRAYVEDYDDPQKALEEKETILPDLQPKQHLTVQTMDPTKHETKPPARYTEASLVQKMEKEGIGRPSTYATIMGTIMDRGYVHKVGPALAPTLTAFAVSDLLAGYFPTLVDTHFTATMEESLDEIAEGTRAYLPYLKEFYLGTDGLLTHVEEAQEKIDGQAAKTIHLGKSLGIDIKIGKFGPYFIKKNESGEILARGSLPPQVVPADLNESMIDALVQSSQEGPVSLGRDPDTQEDIYVLTGRYGPYVQRGLAQLVEDTPVLAESLTEESVSEETGKKTKAKKAKKTVKKPKNKVKQVSLPKGMTPEQVTLEIAVQLLRLPRTLGVHPDTQQEIKVGIGRFGPYIVYQNEFRSIKKPDDVFSIDLSRAVEILSQPKAVSKRGQRVIKTLGKDPQTQQDIHLMQGKFGPYVSDGKNHASLKDPQHAENIALDDALALLNAKIKNPAKKKRQRRL